MCAKVRWMQWRKNSSLYVSYVSADGGGDKGWYASPSLSGGSASRRCDSATIHDVIYR